MIAEKKYIFIKISDFYICACRVVYNTDVPCGLGALFGFQIYDG